MFTGIIKELARVEQVVRRNGLLALGIEAKIISGQAKPSDSISVSGVCLTVTKKQGNLIFFEAIAPTLAKTNLKQLKKGDWVNLEPALAMGEKIGGHFVLGHIDAIARLIRMTKHTGFFTFEVALAPLFKKYIIENGSIALEGVSLTVKRLLARSFTVDIIPFTYDNTNLKYKKPGALLNIEFDYLLKKETIGKLS
jgi:riboflavin synthase